MRTSPLDLKAVQAFILVAQTLSFTRTAEAMDTTQSAVSLHIQRLERRLGRRLVDRTPRRVRLSAEGVSFLGAARDLLAAHDRAVGALAAERRKLVVGLSHQMVGADLPQLLRQINDRHPGLLIELRVGLSSALAQDVERGELDAAIVLHDDRRRRKGERLFAEPIGWMGTAEWRRRDVRPLRLATQGEMCSIRNGAVRALDAAGIAWSEVFIGQGAAALGAAAASGMAIAVLSRRAAPHNTVDVGRVLALPPLPVSTAYLYSNVSDREARTVLRIVSTALRSEDRSG